VFDISGQDLHNPRFRDENSNLSSKIFSVNVHACSMGKLLQAAKPQISEVVASLWGYGRPTVFLGKEFIVERCPTHA
jgi:hypothetical protein